MKKNPKPAPAGSSAPHLEPATEAHIGTPHYGTFGPSANVAAPFAAAGPTAAPGREEDATEAQRRATYAAEDSRYAGGDVFDLKNEQSGL